MPSGDALRCQVPRRVAGHAPALGFHVDEGYLALQAVTPLPAVIT